MEINYLHKIVDPTIGATFCAINYDIEFIAIGRRNGAVEVFSLKSSELCFRLVR